jgi:hypothetical protein
VPLITSPAEFPGTVHMGRALVFSRSICSTPFTTQQDLLKTDHFSRSQSIKEMVLSKNGYRFIFPKGKYTEVLNPKKSKNSECSDDFFQITINLMHLKGKNAVLFGLKTFITLNLHLNRTFFYPILNLRPSLFLSTII